MSVGAAFGLPSLRALDEPFSGPSLRIWLCTGRTDMRCGFDRLAALAQQVTGQDPLSGHLFIFRNRGGDRLKILYFDGDGYVLWYKRLEEGVFKLPRPPKPPEAPPAAPPEAAPAAAGDERAPRSMPLRPSELAMLLDGIDLSSVKRGKRYRRVAPRENPRIAVENR